MKCVLLEIIVTVEDPMLIPDSFWNIVYNSSLEELRSMVSTASSYGMRFILPPGLVQYLGRVCVLHRTMREHRTYDHMNIMLFYYALFYLFMC